MKEEVNCPEPSLSMRVPRTYIKQGTLTEAEG
jgi:hypothetical protein